MRLNVDDADFFTKYVLHRPGSPERTGAVPAKESHKKIAKAAKLAAKHVLAIIEPHKEGVRADRLVDWLDFIRDGAHVIVLIVPDHINAFVMFETLNDRGLKASQADLLKNYLLSHADDRVREAQQKWAQMLGALEAIGVDDITVTYLRHVLISMFGPTKEREVYDRVRANVDSQQRAIEFLDMLVESAQDYTALLNPEHKKWNPYGTTTRKHIETILNLRVEQIRPLMFAVTQRFEAEELKKAFKLFVAWSVRFLIAGGHRGGVLDRAYALRAFEVGTGKVTTAKQLADAMADTVPLDAAFEAAFGKARVSQAYLARYYLRALEQKVRSQTNPELEPTEEQTILNLEHILPEVPEGKWPHFAPEVAAAHYRRLGNMVLLNSKQNSTVGNGTYADKKPILEASTLVLTREAGKYDAWGLPEIDNRQRAMAKLAVGTWPITVE